MFPTITMTNTMVYDTHLIYISLTNDEFIPKEILRYPS